MGLCDTAKANALTNFNNKVWTSTTTYLPRIMEMTQSSDVACVAVYGQVLSDLTAYLGGTAYLYLKCSTFADGESNNPPVPADTKWRPWKSISVGSSASEQVNSQATIPAFTMDCTDPQRNKGWYLYATTTVMEPYRNFKASSPYVSYLPPRTITPDEYLKSTVTQTVSTSETYLSWNASKITINGGMSRSYGNSETEGPITSTSSTQFDGSAPGFNPDRFKDYYRPTILTTIKAVTDVPIILRVYINGTLSQTRTFGIGEFSTSLAFSVKNIGNFGTLRPPNNNPSDNYDGWVSPVLRISAQSTTTSGVVSCGPKITNYVVNYPGA